LQLEHHRIAPEEAARRLEAIVAGGVVTYEVYVHLGRARQLAGDPLAAEKAFRTAIELNPSSKPAYDGLALALIAQGQVDVEQSGLRAQAGFTLGGEFDRLIEGAAHLQAGRLDEAERVYEEILRERPDSAAALLSLAVVAARKGDHVLAIERCRRAIEIEPDLIDAHQQLGMSALALGRLAEAVAALEAAAALNPHDKTIQNRLGVAYVRSGRPDDARTAWRRALEIDPTYEGARHNLERLDARP
jgi:tetratricopeptide (TPR) repeat protein